MKMSCFYKKFTSRFSLDCKLCHVFYTTYLYTYFLLLFLLFFFIGEGNGKKFTKFTFSLLAYCTLFQKHYILNKLELKKHENYEIGECFPTIFQQYGVLKRFTSINAKFANTVLALCE